MTSSYPRDVGKNLPSNIPDKEKYSYSKGTRIRYEKLYKRLTPAAVPKTSSVFSAISTQFDITQCAHTNTTQRDLQHDTSVSPFSAALLLLISQNCKTGTQPPILGAPKICHHTFRAKGSALIHFQPVREISRKCARKCCWQTYKLTACIIVLNIETHLEDLVAFGVVVHEWPHDSIRMKKPRGSHSPYLVVHLGQADNNNTKRSYAASNGTGCMTGKPISCTSSSDNKRLVDWNAFNSWRGTDGSV